MAMLLLVSEYHFNTYVSESICSFYIHGDLFSLYFKTSNVNKKCIFALPTNKVINVPTLLTFPPMKHSRLNEHFTKKHSDKVGNDISYLLVFSPSICNLSWHAIPVSTEVTSLFSYHIQISLICYVICILISTGISTLIFLLAWSVF